MQEKTTVQKTAAEIHFQRVQIKTLSTTGDITWKQVTLLRDVLCWLFQAKFCRKEATWEKALKTQSMVSIFIQSTFNCTGNTKQAVANALYRCMKFYIKQWRRHAKKFENNLDIVCRSPVYWDKCLTWRFVTAKIPARVKYNASQLLLLRSLTRKKPANQYYIPYEKCSLWNNNRWWNMTNNTKVEKVNDKLLKQFEQNIMNNQKKLHKQNNLNYFRSTQWQQCAHGRSA